MCHLGLTLVEVHEMATIVMCCILLLIELLFTVQSTLSACIITQLVATTHPGSLLISELLNVKNDHIMNQLTVWIGIPYHPTPNLHLNYDNWRIWSRWQETSHRIMKLGNITHTLMVTTEITELVSYGLPANQFSLTKLSLKLSSVISTPCPYLWPLLLTWFNLNPSMYK